MNVILISVGWLMVIKTGGEVLLTHLCCKLNINMILQINTTLLRSVQGRIVRRRQS